MLLLHMLLLQEDVHEVFAPGALQLLSTASCA
jgi:hypothetical protein